MAQLEKWQPKFKVPTARGRKQRAGYSNIGEHSGRQGFAHGYAEKMEKGDIPMTSQEQQRLDHAAVQLEKIFGRKKKWQRNEPYTPKGVYSGSERPSRFRRGLSALGRGARGAASGATRAARATGGAAREFGRGAAQESRAMYGGGKSVFEPAPGAVKELRERKSGAQNRQTARLQAENRAANRTDWGKVAAVPEKPLGEGQVRQSHFPPSSKFASGGPKTTNPAYNKKMEKAMISLQKFVDNCGCDE